MIKSLKNTVLSITIILMTATSSLANPIESKNISQKKLLLAMVVYDEFELLDVFGPLEMFGLLHDKVEIVLIGLNSGNAQSSGGPTVVVDQTFDQLKKVDILLIPGGIGTRKGIYNDSLIQQIKALAEKSTYVGTICTGSALLAKTNLLNGKKATTNKYAFQWVANVNSNIHWVKEARWVEDDKYWTSSGVSAGIDMALAMIAKLYGREVATEIANMTEYHWNDDASQDVFAKKFGLTN